MLIHRKAKCNVWIIALIRVFQGLMLSPSIMARLTLSAGGATERSEAVTSPSSSLSRCLWWKDRAEWLELGTQVLRSSWALQSVFLLAPLLEDGERCAGLGPAVGIPCCSSLWRSCNAARSRLPQITCCRFNYCLGTFKLRVLVGTKAASCGSCPVWRQEGALCPRGLVWAPWPCGGVWELAVGRAVLGCAPC